MNTLSYKELKDWYIKNDDAIANAKAYFGNEQPRIHRTGFYSAPSWNWGYQIGLVQIPTRTGARIFEVVTQFGSVVAARSENIPEAGKHIKERLEDLRQELRVERMSYGELAELQELADFIPDGDVELLEAAGVPEFEEDDEDPEEDYAHCRTCDAVINLNHDVWFSDGDNTYCQSHNPEEDK